MRQRAFQLTEAQACEMQGAYHNCQDAQTRTRYQAVRLYGQGYPTREIEAICGCSRSSLMEWCRSYREAGVTGLVDQRVGGNRALLTPHQLERLQYLLGSHTPRQLFGVAGCVGTGQFWSVGDLAQLIQREFDVSYKSETSYRELLDKCGFSYQRPAKQYKSRAALKVAEFEEQLEKTDRHDAEHTRERHRRTRRGITLLTGDAAGGLALAGGSSRRQATSGP